MGKILKLFGLTALVTVIFLSMAACGSPTSQTNGGGNETELNEVAYTGKHSSNNLTLTIIEKKTGKAAYTPKTGDSYKMTVNDKLGSGTVLNMEITETTIKFTLKPSSNGGATFTVIVSINNNKITNVTGTVTFDKESDTPWTGPGNVNNGTTGGGGGGGSGGGGGGGSTTPTVTAVSVIPSTVSVAKGQTYRFGATVSGTNNPAQTVTWTVSGGVTGTGISTDGLLTVAAGETAASVTVKATSTVDASKSGTAVVTITAQTGPAAPTVDFVTVSPPSASVAKGQTLQFSAEISGANNPAQTVTWTVSGGGTGTGINASGLLTVAAGETAASVTVKATSTVNTAKSGTATVTITNSTYAIVIGRGSGTIDDPVLMTVTGQLTDASLSAILSEIWAGLKYVNLDLSAMAGTTFNIDVLKNYTSGELVVSLVLPNMVQSISSTNSAGLFNLKTIIGVNVIDIGDNAFLWAGLTSVNFPKAITIGERTFESCRKLAIINSPALTTIGEKAFYNCESLTSVDFPNAITIGESAFDHCTKLASVSFPKAITIGKDAFWFCNNLTSVSFPEVTTIGNVFKSCSSLTHVDFPKVTTIGEKAFYQYNTLTTVSFPVVTTIGEDAFAYCKNLSSVDLPKATSISDRTFVGCNSLSSVDLPKVTSIGVQAFSDCTSLTSITLPAVTSINSLAFYGCTHLYSVNLPVVISIDSSAFESCTSLTSVNFPRISSIEYNAFGSCPSIEEITLPASITSIGGQTFMGCTSLVKVTCYAVEPPYVDGYTFKYTAESLKIYVPSVSITTYKSDSIIFSGWTFYRDKIYSIP